jgi:capsid portal protein
MKRERASVIYEPASKRGFAGDGSGQPALFSGAEARLQIAPVNDPNEWAELLDMSTRYRRCVYLTAQLTVGLGWTVEVDPRLAERLAAAETKAVEEAQVRLTDLLSYPNPRQAFEVLCTDAKVDQLAEGYGCLEVVRDEDGVIVQLHHIPATIVRLTKAGDYMLSRGGVTYYFARFEKGRRLDPKTGKLVPEGAGKGRYSQVLMFNDYSPSDIYYGTPAAITAKVAIAGNQQAALRNYYFFESDGQPRFAILIGGGDDDTYDCVKKAAEDFIKDVRGNKKKARGLVLQAPTAAQKGAAAPTIEFKELGANQKDATFTEYAKRNDEEIREAFSTAKVMLGTSDDVNRASAFGTMESTVRYTLHPQTVRWERNLWPIAMEFHPALRIRLTKASATDLMGTAEQTAVQAEAGAMTINELRLANNLEPYEDPRADMPLAILKADVAQGALAQAAGVALDAELTRRVDDVRRRRRQAQP